MAPDEFAALGLALAETVRATPPAAGCQEVMLPGDPERRTARERARDGIELAPSTWDSLRAAAAELGVPLQPEEPDTRHPPQRECQETRPRAE
jgi:LDH2 family malate/lactate/ureidoglycolate dehydrogenase